MSGGTQSLIEVRLRNPCDKNDQISYWIEPFDTAIGRDWLAALKEILDKKLILEKNYCFLGFPGTQRNLEYLCQSLNEAIFDINEFNRTGIWQSCGLQEYMIEEFFTPDTVRYGTNYEIPKPGSDLATRKALWGLRLKRGIMNRLHNHFEKLQGTVWNISPYFSFADDNTRYAIRQLNNLCHEIENLVLGLRKSVSDPDWVRPSQITTWISAPRYDLNDLHRKDFATNGYDRRFGHVYMHWTQIGKTLFEVFRDENAPDLNVGSDPTDISVGSGTACEAITALKFYSGEFDVEWAKSVTRDENSPWFDEQHKEFESWLDKNGIDSSNPALSLGYLPVGKVLLQQSFGTTDEKTIWKILEQHLDIYSITVGDVCCVWDYVWSDPDYRHMQMAILEKKQHGGSHGMV